MPKKLNRRILLLSAVLLALCMYGLYNGHRVEALEQDLSRTVQPEVEEILEMDCAVRLVGLETTAARRYGLFGEPMGKVSVFVVTRSNAAEQYVVYDYFYRRENDQWVFSESGACLHGHDYERARELDIERGYPGLKPMPPRPVAQVPPWARHPAFRDKQAAHNDG